jgi:hypothetical protein
VRSKARRRSQRTADPARTPPPLRRPVELNLVGPQTGAAKRDRVVACGGRAATTHERRARRCWIPMMRSASMRRFRSTSSGPDPAPAARRETSRRNLVPGCARRIAGHSPRRPIRPAATSRCGTRPGTWQTDHGSAEPAPRAGWERPPCTIHKSAATEAASKDVAPSGPPVIVLDCARVSGMS